MGKREYTFMPSAKNRQFRRRRFGRWEIVKGDELTKFLPADFNRQVVIQTETLDGYDLLDPKQQCQQNRSAVARRVARWRVAGVATFAASLERHRPGERSRGKELRVRERIGAWWIVELQKWVEESRQVT